MGKAPNVNTHLIQEHLSSQRRQCLPLGRADEVLHSQNVPDEFHTLHGHAALHEFCYAMFESRAILSLGRGRYPRVGEVLQSLRDLVHFRTKLE